MVDVNVVYETVLSILNKEQRGYLDPSEFNQLAVQVQREIFESYFLKELNAPSGNTDYSDPDKNISEKIAIFENTVTVNETEANISFFNYPSDFYRLGVVINSEHNVIIDEVSHKDVAYINLSHLTAPTEKQPVYVREPLGIKCYPDTDTNSVNTISMNYLKQPSDPNWGYLLDGADFAYNPATDATGNTNGPTVHFELHNSEQHEIIVRILSYAGVVVRDPAITGFAQQIEGKIQGTEA